MSSDFYSRDDPVERGPIPLDIDNVHMLLQGQSPRCTVFLTEHSEVEFIVVSGICFWSYTTVLL